MYILQNQNMQNRKLFKYNHPNILLTNPQINPSKLVNPTFIDTQKQHTHFIDPYFNRKVYTQMSQIEQHHQSIQDKRQKQKILLMNNKNQNRSGIKKMKRGCDMPSMDNCKKKLGNNDIRWTEHKQTNFVVETNNIHQKINYYGRMNNFTSKNDDKNSKILLTEPNDKNSFQKQESLSKSKYVVRKQTNSKRKRVNGSNGKNKNNVKRKCQQLNNNNNNIYTIYNGLPNYNRHIHNPRYYQRFNSNQMFSKEPLHHQNFNQKSHDKQSQNVRYSKHRLHIQPETRYLSSNAIDKVKKQVQRPFVEQQVIQIIQKIGQGTFGQVFKALFKPSNKIVAVKKVYQDKKYKNRELEILGLLDNSFVIKVLFTYYTTQKHIAQDKQTIEQKQYLNVVMEYYQQNLFQVYSNRLYKEKHKLLTDIQIKIYMYQIFRGLNYIHSLNICHRDIKPPNILVNQNLFKLIICDFGSAKKLIKSQINVSYICSRCYRAPELIFGSTSYTTMIDIWSAGCVLLELLKGQPFFIGESNIDQLVQIIKILGTPSKTQVFNMNPQYDLQDYKFPMIKSRDWKQIFPKAHPSLISLIKQLMLYSPKQRLTACEALAHQYFDDIRQQKIYGQYILGSKCKKKKKKQKQALSSIFQTETQNLGYFEFSDQQIKGKQHLLDKLIPSWYLQYLSRNRKQNTLKYR